VIARYGDSVAFVSSWADSYQASALVVYSYTDRPVYRPGHKVRYRGVVRSFEDEKYATPVGQPVTVEVRDPNDTLIHRTQVTTDRFGCYHGELDLNREAATGSYSLVTQTAGGKGSSSSFTVAAYKKPEFTAKIAFGKKRYVQGDRIRAKITANYYFGSPVVNAKVQYYVRRSPYYFFAADEENADLESESGDGYSDYGGYGEIIAEGNAVTDDNGEATISFRADWPKSRDVYDWGSDQSFGVEVEVVDQADRSVSQNSSVVATQGQYALRLSPGRYVVSPGESVQLEVETAGYNGRPAAERDVELSIGYYNWQSESNQASFVAYQTKKVKTDRDGKAVLDYVPTRAGEVVVIGKSRDSKGNVIKQETWMWAQGDGLDQQAENYRFPKLKIITDKKTYNAGDTARVVINSDVTGPTVLVTVEGTRIYDRYTVKLDNKSTSLEIPIRSTYKPNFYISACYISKKRMENQTVSARVSINEESLDVSIEPSKNKLEAGEKISYLVKCRDNEGRPVRAQFSMGVVDEAIYAIAEDGTPKMIPFFYARRYNAVSTAFSFPEIYLSDPDKAGMPEVRGEPRTRVRKRFEDTAFWSPNVETDDSGEASVTFDLPDNLTTWRTTVRAISSDTVCGEARNTVVVSQPLLVRLITPRFVVADDRTNISAMVHNYSGRGQRVEVSIEAPGLSIKGATTRRIQVNDGASTRVDWTATAGGVGDVEVKVVAKGVSASDAVEMLLPVNPRGVPRDFAEVGSIAGDKETAVCGLNVRDDAVLPATTTTVRIAPSLASAMLGSLDYLAKYPYGCTEQTTSSFLPDVILSRALERIGVRKPALERSLPDMVATGLSRLYRLQNYSGGWGWCEYGEEDPWMTAYVCYALIQARNAGFVVNDDILGKGLYRLQELAGSKKTPLDERIYCQYVMALAGKDARASLRSINYRSAKASSLAYASMAFGVLGSSDQQRSLLQMLYQKATVSNVAIHWGDSPETTAVALEATLRSNPNDPRAEKIVRYLMERRRGNYWYSTRETAMVLYAMTEYLAVTGELKPDYEAVVSVNGAVVARQKIGPDALFAPEMRVDVPADRLKPGSNRIEISRHGTGSLYWSVSGRQFVAKEKMPPLVSGSGISITREFYNPGPRFFSGDANAKLGSRITSCAVGDVVLVRVAIDAKTSFSRLLIEDYIPAGCEIIDKGTIERWDWNYWWVDKDVRDERISFFLDRVGPGRHVVDYQMRAGIAGIYTAMPAQVYAMYEPAVRASTAGVEFRVR